MPLHIPAFVINRIARRNQTRAAMEHEANHRHHRRLSLSPSECASCFRTAVPHPTHGHRIGYTLGAHLGSESLRPAALRALQLSWRQLYGCDGQRLAQLVDAAMARTAARHPAIQRVFDGVYLQASGPPMTQRVHTRLILDMLAALIDECAARADGARDDEAAVVEPVEVCTVGALHAAFYADGVTETVVDCFGEELFAGVSALDAVLENAGETGANAPNCRRAERVDGAARDAHESDAQRTRPHAPARTAHELPTLGKGGRMINVSLYTSSLSKCA